MVDNDELDRVSGAVHRRDVARIFRMVLALALLAVIVAVALDNRDDVRVGYLVDEALAPGWVVIVLSALGGMIIGGLLRLRSRHRA